ncbi:MAG: M20/M25/M40 family metallo-hydrolase [Candidatus Acidiferrales bacterium]
MRKSALTAAVTLLVMALIPPALLHPVAAQQAAVSQERVDLDAIYKIKDEGFNRSKVMETMSYLTDIYGPRLTNSPNMHAAADWTMKSLTAWGLTNVKKEAWGPFGRGWANHRITMHVTSPQRWPVISYPLAWSPGTKGPVTGEAVIAEMDAEADFEKWRGKLKGKFVLLRAMREVPPQMEAPGRRYTAEDLDERAEFPIPTDDGPGDPARFGRRRQFQRQLSEFLVKEGVAGVIDPSSWNSGLVRVGGVDRDEKAPSPVRVMVAIEHYGRIIRTLEKKMPVTIELDVQNQFYEQDLNSYNIVADIPGNDQADEVVMLGAHFDSWHSGTGATDNAAGSSVMLEAVRILKASGVKLRRTVRLALWTGEEQGLLGSRAYAEQNLASVDRTNRDAPKWVMKPGHAKLSGYFNIDNGTGKIRGVYLQGNEAIRPVFEAWMEPFRNVGMTTLSLRNTGGTDHLAFNEVGLPGFQFIQDPMEYGTKSHHSNMDTYERIQEADMKQMAVIVASFVYHAANREQLLPRKSMPDPPPQRGRRDE